jgi:hypothetical protein
MSERLTIDQKIKLMQIATMIQNVPDSYKIRYKELVDSISSGSEDFKAGRRLERQRCLKVIQEYMVESLQRTENIPQEMKDAHRAVRDLEY